MAYGTSVLCVCVCECARAPLARARVCARARTRARVCARSKATKSSHAHACAHTRTRLHLLCAQVLNLRQHLTPSTRLITRHTCRYVCHMCMRVCICPHAMSNPLRSCTVHRTSIHNHSRTHTLTPQPNHTTLSTKSPKHDLTLMSACSTHDTPRDEQKHQAYIQIYATGV